MERWHAQWMLAAVAALCGSGCLAERASTADLKAAAGATKAADAALDAGGVGDAVLGDDLPAGVGVDADATPDGAALDTVDTLVDAAPDAVVAQVDAVDSAADAPDTPDALAAAEVAETDAVLPVQCASKDCDDGVACTFDGCDPMSGCSHGPKNGQCDDGVVCTSNTCDAKAGCVFTASDAACDDGLACTADACDTKADCLHTPGLFNHSYGGSGSDAAFAIASLAGGGFALAGSSNSINLSGGQKTAGGQDFWLVRTAKDGSPQWSKTYGGSADDYAQDVAALADGGFALAGGTNSPDLLGGQKTAGNWDCWLVRTDKAGTLVWSKTYGGTGSDQCNSVAQLADGGFALFGGTASTDLPGGQKSGVAPDFWLLRTDQAGVLLWSKTYDSGAGDAAAAMAALADGGFVLLGDWYAAGGVNPHGRLVRTDKAGALLWAKTYGGNGADHLFAVAQLAGDGFALAGFTNSTNLPGGQKLAGGDDAWLVRADQAGTLLWSKTYGGTGDDRGSAVAQLADGGFALLGAAGSTSLPGGQKTAGGDDFWLVRTDEAGTLLWSKTLGGSGSEWAQAIAPLTDGGFALAGYTTSPDLPGGQKTAGSADFWLVRTDAWGHAACADAGGCFTKAATDCDDANACTADQCDASAGCSHASLPDGSACAAGKTCGTGVCK